MRPLLAILVSLWGAAPPPAAPVDETAARRDQIEALKKTVQAGKADADSLRKLGDLYLEEHYVSGEEAKSAPNAALAVQQYKAFVDGFPTAAQLDQVLLALGEAQLETGDAKAAMATFRRIVKELPKSKAVGDAWLAIGRQLFDGSKGSDRLADAQEALQRAVKLKTGEPAAAQLLLARVASEQGEYAAALDHLRLAIDAAGVDDAEVAQDARREFVAIYTRAGEPANAIAEVKKVGGPLHSWELLKDLANAYHERNRNAEAAKLYRQLMAERPSSPDMPLFRCRLVGYVMRGGDKKVILAEVRELAAAVKMIQAQGDFASEADRRSFAEAKAKALSIVSTLATNWHEEALESETPAAVTIAEDICNVYLGLFPENPPADVKRCSEGF
jgi:tetratricopeptide (TPR) repeat protein